MIYGYIRVSSDKQTVENQRFEINNFCERENIKIDGWIEETISGTKAYNKRQLGTLLRRVQKDDLIICAELSRLGRNLFMIMEILNICMTKECRMWTIKDNYKLGEDIQSKKQYAVNVNLNLTFSYTIYQMGHINSTIVFNNRINRIHTITKCHFLRCNVSISDN